MLTGVEVLSLVRWVGYDTPPTTYTFPSFLWVREKGVFRATSHFPISH
jgi:hypothetical protein